MPHPELGVGNRSKICKVFAFLQDDVTRKLPTVELALRLFCRTQRGAVDARVIFSPQAALRESASWRQLVECGSGTQTHRGAVTRGVPCMSSPI